MEGPLLVGGKSGVDDEGGVVLGRDYVGGGGEGRIITSSNSLP